MYQLFGNTAKCFIRSISPLILFKISTVYQLFINYQNQTVDNQKVLIAKKNNQNPVRGSSCFFLDLSVQAVRGPELRDPIVKAAGHDAQLVDDAGPPNRRDSGDVVDPEF